MSTRVENDLGLDCVETVAELNENNLITMEMKLEEEKVQQQSQDEYQRQLKEMVYISLSQG